MADAMQNRHLALVLVLAAVLIPALAAAQTADHLQCYKIKDTLRLTGTVDLTSPQFGFDDDCKISKAQLFCVPADKTDEQVIDPTTGPITPLPVSAAPAPGDRVCYKVKCPRPAVPLPDEQVTDQFGTRHLSKFTAQMVCTPAVKGAAYCGDGAIDAGEDCEPGDLDGATCATEGFASGALACAPGCTFDTSGCVPNPPSTCGNGAIDGSESCDGADLGGMSCVSLGFASGTLGCTAGCGLDVSGCVPNPPDTCGNGTIEGDESCDGGDLGGATCASLGYTLDGMLGCTAGCGYDMSGCTSQAFPATGQITCWNSAGAVVPCAGTGQDGDVQAGAALAYVDNGDGTITDLNTGLMWEKQSNDGSIHDADNTYTWNDAFAVHLAGLNGAAFGGYMDWRLPNLNELESIRNLEILGTAIALAFNSGCPPGCTVLACSCTFGSSAVFYWSASSSRHSPTEAWYVNFARGEVGAASKVGGELHVRAVRGGS